MKMVKHLSSLLCLPAIFCCNPSAASTGSTFQFIAPAWTELSNTLGTAEQFGSLLRLEITVDNGQSSVTNQSYDFTQIVRVKAYAINGAYNFDTIYSTGPFDINAERGSQPVIKTDASGAPILQLGQRDAFTGHFWARAIAQIGDSRTLMSLDLNQMGFDFYPIQAQVSTNNLLVTNGCAEPGCYAVAGERAKALDIGGTYVGAALVPEPETWLTFGIGLMLLGVVVWQRKAPDTAPASFALRIV